MLRLPVKGEPTHPLILPKHTVALGESDEARRERQSAEIFDETFTKKQATDPVIFRIIISGAVTLVIALLTGFFWPRGNQSSGPGISENFLPTDVPEETADEIQLDTLSPDLVLKQLQPVVSAFLEASTLKEASMQCRRSTRTLSRMQKLYGDSYYPPGFRNFVWNRPMTRDGNWAELLLEDKEFQIRPIALVLEDAEWRVDWESWVGWSEITMDELKETKPTESVLMRVTTAPIDYYNFSFSDELAWSSYRLSDADRAETVYGYVPSLGELDLQLKPNPDETNLRFTLRVKFPEGPQSNNQLIIEEIVAKGWLVKEDPQ
jgi:hypothetical protein